MRRQRVAVVFVVLLAGLIFVELRLVRLQVLQTEVWARESQRSTMRFESLPFERGWILDRHGEPLARTEGARDLQFRFREWRRGSTSGRAAALLRLLDGRRRPVVASVRELDEWLEALGSVELAELAALQPRQRRVDALTYLSWIFGEEHAEALDALLVDESPPAGVRLADLPHFEQGRQLSAERGLAERRALTDLARVAGVGTTSLLEAMDAGELRADERVARILSGDEPPLERYERTQDLHAEFDRDPIVVAEGVSYDCQTLVAVRGQDLPGLDVAVEQRRVYPGRAGDVAPLLIGRVGMPRADDVEQTERDRVRLADLASLEDLSAEELSEYEQLRLRVREIDYTWTEERGTLGLESALEPLLRGKRGWIASVRDPELGDLANVESAPPQRGLNVTLTLDLGLQTACEELLDEVLAGEVLHGADGTPEHWMGAIAIVDPRSGHVLAVASAPRPTRFDMERNWGELLADPQGPLFDRALGPGVTGNLPPPGSVFKPIAALAGLASGAVAGSEGLECDGRLSVGPQTLRCLGRHGDVSMRDAIAWSCNLYFYRLADRVGGDVLRRTARAFGFGRPVNLLEGNEMLAAMGIPVDSGLKERWKPISDHEFVRSEAMRFAIGNAPLDDVSPLQVASAIGALGVGYVRPPSLIAAVEGYGQIPPREARAIGGTEEHLAVVREGMERVVDHYRGTAFELAAMLGHTQGGGRPVSAALAKQVAGKTGTPEVENMPDHSWFAGYLPRDEPRLAFAILLEHTGEHGGDACVPLLSELMRRGALDPWLDQPEQP